ncbi:MAG: DNA-directed RNA polymerase subunit beta [Fibrobacteria bacterium]|nr:DNA-directed RNA polymerase subunit beta [Fibrobacteria bacterium]
MKQLVDRRNYASNKFEYPMPYLLEVQVSSFKSFLQADVPPDKRKSEGLQKIFGDIFPIKDIKEFYSLEFDSYNVGEPKYTARECFKIGMTYAAPLKATLSLNVFEGEGEDRKFVEKITNDVYIGDLPLITERGTFVVNGAERVIVSQLHRSPGVSFDEAFHPNGGRMFKARIIPHKGSWVEFLVDVNDCMYINIDRRRKIPATILLRAIGYSTNHDILKLFYQSKEISLTQGFIESMDEQELILFEDVIDMETGELVVESGTQLTSANVVMLQDKNVKKVTVVDDIKSNAVIFQTLSQDPTNNEEDALFKIYNLIRPGEPPNVNTARELLKRLFFDEKRYDLGELGRYRLNARLKLNVDENIKVMTEHDFLAIMKYLVALKAQEGTLDDIDHLGNRRVRCVGELIQEQFALGLTRMSRTIRERLSLRDTDDLTPQDLVNARTVSTVIASFFGSSQLSQFMDQMNPLAELTHKRRMSALGPDGLSRERAGFEVRDVHYTHYGRLCPIETPEGPNIGLISSLATFGRVNRFGFIETPYRKVENGRVTEEVIFLTADKEDDFIIAPASTAVSETGEIESEFVIARFKGEFPNLEKTKIHLIDVSPKQVVSVAASLIPFLEHDDANRALMGSNMQRQAVPLLKTDSPIIGTGMEAKAAYDSGVVVKATNAGFVSEVDSKKIVIQRDNQEKKEEDFIDMPEFDVYHLQKFERSNQDSCINQKPLVSVGQKIDKGDVIADGPSTDRGELAMGKNIKVAFLPWNGYNFEDAIILSEELCKDDVFTSIHIEEFNLEVRDTKRGPEELTREIPNVMEESLTNLDENGIIRIGAEVESGDILVGKVTPKGETELSPEERLLRAIFGEKAGDVRDSSLKAPPGMHGVVVETRVFSRKERDKKTKKQDKEKIDILQMQYSDKIQNVIQARDKKLVELLLNAEACEIRDSITDEVIVSKGKKLTEAILSKISWSDLSFSDGLVSDEKINKIGEKVLQSANDMIRRLEDRLDKEIDKIVVGGELKPGVLQLVKVYVAKKRKISVGDKMAGRHGNKGVIAKIVPVEDMPFDKDGNPVQIILNPLGVPSRMNVGQLLETHLGWAAQTLGIRISTPVFDGASFEQVKEALSEAKLPETGKTVLFDGKTGERFDQEICVGIMYILKLGHLVDDKIHARSIGPYSLVTQQPLGGKSQFGGQRFGEMEVWALEAYGAAYTLQELLTVKSDDVLGRSKIYESIVKGENAPRPGIPESFNVLIKEIQALCLDIRFTQDNEETPVA